MSDIRRNTPLRLITHRQLLKRLLNSNLPEIIITPSVIEHKRERGCDLFLSVPD